MDNRLPVNVTHAPKREITGQLLTTLEQDKERVAILCTREDLRLIIDCLRGESAKHGTNALQFADDAETLYGGVFK